MTRDEILTIYESAIARAGLERKGKTMPYTSSNGYMFSQLNKDLEIGIRLSKADTEEFDKEFGARPFMSYGAKMREYVLLPEELLSQVEMLSVLLKKGFDHVNSLPPK